MQDRSDYNGMAQKLSCKIQSCNFDILIKSSLIKCILLLVHIKAHKLTLEFRFLRLFWWDLFFWGGEEAIGIKNGCSQTIAGLTNGLFLAIPVF